MICKFCESSHVQKDGNHNGFQRYRCIDCGKRFDGERYNNSYFIHFNIKLKKTDRNLLTRENYCIPTNNIDYIHKKNILYVKRIIEVLGAPPGLTPPCYLDIPNKIFADEEHYTPEYVEEHYYACMKNFDLNMKFFDNLDPNKFNRHLMSIIRKNKLKEISDLSTLSHKPGVYIMVLDKYKQVYIGVSDSGVKERIISHWSAKKDFARLICGKVETSILSIDSFGALDTTRIFYKELNFSKMHELESKLVSQFKPEYRLNRVAGGLNAEYDSTIRNLGLMASMQKRQLIDTD